MADRRTCGGMQLIELLAASEEAQDLETLAATLQCDVRTIRRDLDQCSSCCSGCMDWKCGRGKVLVGRGRVTAPLLHRPAGS